MSMRCNYKVREPYANVASAWEELTELMERAREDAIRIVESLFDAVAMVDINIDVQDAGVDPTVERMSKRGNRDFIHWILVLLN